MLKQGTVSMLSPDQMRDLGSAVIQQLPGDIPGDIAQGWIGNKSALRDPLRRLLIPPEPMTVPDGGADFAEKLAYMENFWRRLFPTLDFGFEPDNMLVWPRKPGHDRLLVTPAGLWGNRLWEKFEEKKIPCWRYTSDLDKMVHLSGAPYVATARWFRDRQEADEELAGKSALDLEASLIPGIIMPEHELYELVYFEETGDHLDRKNTTLISGSRGPDGDVPYADWDDDEFSVYDDDADARGPYLRARSAG